MSIINRKMIKYLYIAYAAVLLCFLAGYYMIPGEGFLPMPDNGDDMVRKAQTERERLYKNILTVTEGEYKGLHIIKKWSFVYSGDKLDISFSRGNQASHRVFVEYKDTDDGIVEIQQLATRSVISYVDVTEKASKPVDVELTGNTLSIITPGLQEIEIKRFELEFPLEQFTKSPVFMDESYYYAASGANVIIIRVPERVEVNEKGIILIKDLIQ